jgi:hypothetical protein
MKKWVRIDLSSADSVSMLGRFPCGFRSELRDAGCGLRIAGRRRAKGGLAAAASIYFAVLSNVSGSAGF